MGLRAQRAVEASGIPAYRHPTIIVVYNQDPLRIEDSQAFRLVLENERLAVIGSDKVWRLLGVEVVERQGPEKTTDFFVGIF